MVGESGGRTHQFATVVAHLSRIGILMRINPDPLLHRSPDARLELVFKLVGYDQFIHQYLDAVVLVPVEFHSGQDLPELPVYTGQ